MKKEKIIVTKLEMFDALMENIPDSIYFKDLKSRFIGISKAVTERLKICNSNEALGKTDYDFFTKEHADKAFCDEQNIIKTNIPLIKNDEKETYEGREDRWVSTTKMPLYSKNGKIIGTFGISRDITERKKAEQVLEESKKTAERYLNVAAEIIMSLDNEGNITLLNDSGHKLLGYNNNELIGKNWFETCLPDEVRDDVYGVFKKLVNGDIENVLNHENKVKIKSGELKTILWHNTLLMDSSGNITGLMSSGEDITERKKAVKALKESEEKFSKAFQTSPYAIIITRARDGKLIEVNDAFTLISGYTCEEAKSSSSIVLNLWEDIKNREWVLSALKKSIEVKDKEFKFRKKNGEIIICLFTAQIIHINNEPFILSSIADITERKDTENKIAYLSFHDYLTGLYNRRFFEEEIKRLDTKRQLPLSVIMGDLNGLKLINDTFSHNTGDNVLKEAAGILKRICRSDDILARWGGDEFVILLPKTSINVSEKIVDRIKKEFKKLSIQKIPISISIGSSTKSGSLQGINEVIMQAESNMYKNKLTEKESNGHSIISALEQTLSEKSNETLDHTLRIKNLAIKLGKSIKLHSSQLDELSLLASLHDIGKVAIPITILLKEDKLTKEEWKIIKRHTEIGFNIAQASPQISHIARYILSCHENWDGSGYPQGLRGEAIPIIARIVFICDAYDVMTSERTYKKAMSKVDAIKELIRCAGTQFDPVLVEKFIEIMKK